MRNYTFNMRQISLFVLAFILSLFSAYAQDPVTYEPAFPSLSFEFPAEIQNAADGSNRMFVVEQSGSIKVFENDESTSTQATFLDVKDIISFSSGQEIGLLGLAFHPDYASNGFFYVYHTRESEVSNVNVEIVLARYTVSADNPDIAEANSRLEIFSFDKNQANSNHNGGKIAFGPDGYLYISVGDGGGGGDPKGNAQDLSTIFGSILRIDVDIDGSNPVETNPDAPQGNYEIPSDNPRVGKSGLDEQYAWGIRNTWKFSFDNATNRLWAADVGQNAEEEINIIENGGNYGWKKFEGNSTYSNGTTLTTTPDTKPVFTYDHNNGDVSITGGYVYRGGSTNPLIVDKYIYGDFVSGRVWSLNYNEADGAASSQLLFRTTGENISSFGLDESGELYFSSYGSAAQLFKITGGDVQSPSAVTVDGVGRWEELGAGTDGPVNAVVTDGKTIFVAGNFTKAGTLQVSNIAAFSESEGWQSLKGGADGEINSLALGSDGTIYAGGNFDTIGGIQAKNIAAWNGSSWSALGAGTSGSVAKIALNASNDLYIAGEFITAGETTVNNIAKWSGSWEAITDESTGIAGTNNEIRSIAFDEDANLYVGGNFASAGGVPANRIAMYDGSNWGSLGSGTSGFVQAIEVIGQYIYAGGNFAIAGGKSVNRIARWDRDVMTWQPLNGGLSGAVNAIVYDGQYVYAAGSFETAKINDSVNYKVNNIARWTEENGWQALGTYSNVGTTNQINFLALNKDNSGLIAGGSFLEAGNKNALNLATWNLGFISREYWTGIPGASLADLITNIKYPNEPSGTDVLYSLEAVDWNNPGDSNTWADNYGQRIRGYLQAPTSGDYKFWISGDEESDLLLSTTESSENAVVIAKVSSKTAFREWNKFEAQESTTIALEADKKYYIEVLNKEGIGEDHLSVGWKKPEDSGNMPFEIIPGSVLYSFFEQDLPPDTVLTSNLPGNFAQFTLFPNPLTKGEQLNVKLSQPQENFEIILMDLNGKILSHEKHVGSLFETISVNQSGIESQGIYLDQIRFKK